MEKLLKDYNDSLERLKEAIAKYNGKDDIIGDGIIHRFRLTFLITWRLLRDYLIKEGYDLKVGTQKELLQFAFKAGIIENGDAWILMIKSYEDISHFYENSITEQICSKIQSEYVKLFEDLSDSMKKIIE